jgi:RimJ/RimL family protein N-acetyltransferase
MSDAPWPPPLRWPAEPLTDGVVLLDRLTEADVPRVVLGCTDEASQHWLPLPNPYGEPEASSFIGSREAAAQSGDELTFAVRGVDDGLLAGAMGLSQRGYRHEADIGYWTAPDRRGRGWTARAVRLVAFYALSTMPLRRVEVLAAVGNEHSQGVAHAAGATYEGVRRRGMPMPDEGDAAVFSLIRTDFDRTSA